MRFTRRVIVALAILVAPTCLLAMPGSAQADNNWCVQAGASTAGPATPTGPCQATPTEWWNGCATVNRHTDTDHGVEVWQAVVVCYASPIS
jgi:hypothetical protein